MIEMPVNNVTISNGEYTQLIKKAHNFDILYKAMIDDTTLELGSDDVLRPNGDIAVLNLATTLYNTTKPLTQHPSEHPYNVRVVKLQAEREKLEKYLKELNGSERAVILPSEDTPHKVSTALYGTDSREGGAESWQ